MRGKVAKRLIDQARAEHVETGEGSNIIKKRLKKEYKTKPPVYPKFKVSKRQQRIEKLRA